MSKSLNLRKIREETPSVGGLVHFNNAGSSLMPNPVYKSYMDFQEEEWREGGYETGAKRADEINSFYSETAHLLNCSSNEIAFTDSATTSWQRVFFSIPWRDGDEIITANAEYASNYISFLRLKKFVDVEIKVAGDTSEGEVDISHLEKLITSKTKLIAITHMPTLSGLVNPIEDIGKIARKHEVLYLVDACQSVGQYPLDTEKIQCDFLTGTGRKYLRAPRGTGLLFVKESTIDGLDPMSVDLYSARWLPDDQYKMRKNARRFEVFETNYAAKVGLATAIKYQNDLDIKLTWERIQHLSGILRSELQNLGIEVHDRGKVLSGIVTFSFQGKSPAEVQRHLANHRINVSYASIFNSRLYMEEYDLAEVVRASVHYFNTEAEIAEFCKKLRLLT